VDPEADAGEEGANTHLRSAVELGDSILGDIECFREEGK